MAKHFSNSTEPSKTGRLSALSQAKQTSARHASGVRGARFADNSRTGISGSPIRSQRPAPKKSSGLGLLIALSVVVLVLVIAVVLVRPYLFPAKSDPADAHTPQQIELTIEPGSGAQAIAELLASNKVIDSKEAFLKEVGSTGVDAKLRPGTYSFESHEGLDSVINKLVKGGKSAGQKLTIPEGYTLKQTAEKVEKDLGLSAEEFIAQAKASKYEVNFDFVKGAYQDSLEGFLYPKTYVFEGKPDVDAVITQMLKQYQKETAQLDFSKAAAYKLEPYQALIAASLIERETRVEAERPRIAGVINNRLAKGMALQIDAAIQYALGKTKERLSTEDLKVNSPYNVYTNKGLPPGPICSPSLSSIQAVLNPESHAYLYYVLTSKDGSHTFTETYEDFLKAKQEGKKVFSS